MHTRFRLVCLSVWLLLFSQLAAALHYHAYEFENDHGHDHAHEHDHSDDEQSQSSHECDFCVQLLNVEQFSISSKAIALQPAFTFGINAEHYACLSTEGSLLSPRARSPPTTLLS